MADIVAQLIARLNDVERQLRDLQRKEGEIAYAVLKALTSAGLRIEDDAGNVIIYGVDGGSSIGFATSDVEAVGGAYATFQLGQTALILFGKSTNGFYNCDNAYYDGAWKYRSTGPATFYSQQNGAHIFATAASGSADAAITWGNVVVLAANGRTGVGNVPAPTAKLHVDQDSTTAAIPVITADQADLSEEFIEFVSTIGAGNPIDTAAIGTYYGKLRVSVNGTFKYLALYNS